MLRACRMPVVQDPLEHREPLGVLLGNGRWLVVGVRRVGRNQTAQAASPAISMVPTAKPCRTKR